MDIDVIISGEILGSDQLREYELVEYVPSLEHYILDNRRNLMFDYDEGHCNPAHGVQIVPTM